MHKGVATAAVALVLSAGSAAGSLPGRNGVLAFSAPPPVQQLFSIAVDGSDEQQLAFDFAQPFFPRWSPTGDAVAFLAYRSAPHGTGTALAVAATDGSSERVLDDSALTGADPAWAPDGQRIAFAHGDGAVSEVWIVNRDGSGKRRLGNGAAPAWSPDGKSIAAADGHDLVVYDSGSGARHVVTGVANDTWLPSWSPRGDEIAYTALDRNDQTTATIRLVSATGADDRLVTSGFSATWSPDGSRLAVVKRFYDAGPLEVVDRTGAVVARFEDAKCYGPTWSPNGRLLAFTAGSDPNRLVVAAADGTASRVVVDERGNTYIRDPDWSPDGKRVAYARSRTNVQTNQIYTLDAGGTVRPLTTELDAQQPAWSPDGEELAYTVSDGAWHALAGAPSKGVAERAITSGPDDSQPSWSPDGSRLAFVRSNHIAIVTATGQHARLLRRGRSPSWSPNGRRIAFLVGPDLWTMRPDGGGARRVVSAARAGSPLGAPTWTQDGRAITVLAGRVLLVAPDGSSLRPLDISAALDGSPFDHPVAVEWSPDGSLLALALWHELGRIVLFDPSTGAATVVAANVPTSQLSWQPKCTQTGDELPNTLAGTSGGDVLCGLGGADRLTGGRGSDRIYGGAGDDRIAARDKAFDIVGCGPGRDAVSADRIDLVGVDCERVTRR